jgi:hypothetical protein
MRLGAGPRSVVSAAVLLAALAACTPQVSTEARPPAPPSAPAPVRTVVPVPSTVQTFPDQPPFVHYGTVDDPEIGTAYEHHLYVHCGIRAAEFGGRWWSAVTPAGNNPFPGNRAPGQPDPNHLHGSMTLVAPDLARFEWDGGSADFAPAAAAPPPCA